MVLELELGLGLGLEMALVLFPVMWRLTEIVMVMVMARSAVASLQQRQKMTTPRMLTQRQRETPITCASCETFCV